MPEYKIELARPAATYLSRLDKPIQKRIVNSLKRLALNPLDNLLDIKPLSGRAGQMRLRVGNYRIIYRLENDILVIYVIAIGPRGDIYK